jgi:hypothetical protein
LIDDYRYLLCILTEVKHEDCVNIFYV